MLFRSVTNQVVATTPGGQSSQALVYIPNAVSQGDGLANLEPLGNSGIAAHVVMGAPGSSPEQSVTTVSINNQGLIDLVEAAVTGLQPKQSYQLVLVEHATFPYGEIQPLETFQTNPAGAAIVTTAGPIKQVVANNVETQRRYLAIVPFENGNQGVPVQVQLSLD